jgi:hypothetical protein
VFSQEILQQFLVDKRYPALYTIRILFQTAKAPRKYRCVVASFYKVTAQNQPKWQQNGIPERVAPAAVEKDMQEDE